MKITKRKAKTLFIIFAILKYINIFTYADPDFLIIGAAKAGTTTIYNWLIQHPQILSAKTKELHFFDLQFEKGLNWYRNQFPTKKAGQITGEASPLYMLLPHIAERIKKSYPNIKIIITLRNPIDRAFSHYKASVARKNETKTFEEAMLLEDQRLLHNSHYQDMSELITFNMRAYSYITRSKYIEQLKKWFELFDKNQIHVIIFENFFNNPKNSLNKLFQFLGVQKYDLSEYKKYNPTQLPDVKLTYQTRKELEKIFLPYNLELEKFLNIKLPW